MRPAAGMTAFVLHRYDWSESSLVLELFTREKGRLTVVAKGAKRPYSQLRSVLLPFQRILVATTRASEASEIQTLRSAEWAGGAAMFSGAALFSGFYLNELLMKLLARLDAQPALFDAYAQVLQVLHAGPDEPQAQAALRAFEMRLLSDTGVLPDLSLCTLTQQPVLPRAAYRLTADMGVSEVDTSAPPMEDALPGALLVAVQAALIHGSFEALRQACAGDLAALKVALRGLLHYHLGSSPLRTRQLMREVHAIERRGGT